jgi:hypothetical protein
MKFKVGFFIEAVLGDIIFHIELTMLKSKWYSSIYDSKTEGMSNQHKSGQILMLL